MIGLKQVGRFFALSAYRPTKRGTPVSPNQKYFLYFGLYFPPAPGFSPPFFSRPFVVASLRFTYLSSCISCFFPSLPCPSRLPKTGALVQCPPPPTSPTPRASNTSQTSSSLGLKQIQVLRSILRSVWQILDLQVPVVESVSAICIPLLPPTHHTQSAQQAVLLCVHQTLHL